MTDIVLHGYNDILKEEAQYRPAQLSDYANNPLIEALPNIRDEVQSTKLFLNLPPHSAEERLLPRHLRMHCLQRIGDLVVPLERNVDLDQAISVMIRRGYKSRNPILPSFHRQLRHIALSLENPDIADAERALFPVSSPVTSGKAIFGPSGMGKSLAFERILATYPSMIRHVNYKGQNLPFTQVVWLKVDCPHDGSVRAMALDMVMKLDDILGTTEFRKLSGHSAANMVPTICKLAASCALGILVIDEIQHLQVQNSGGQSQMMNFFARLINEIGVPVFLVGTPKAKPLFKNEFRNGRKQVSSIPISDNDWDIPPFSRDKYSDWSKFLTALSKYQWTHEPMQLTTPELAQVMYEESMGVLDVAAKLFAAVQYRAMVWLDGHGKEQAITGNLIRQVSADSLSLIRPALNKLGTGDTAGIEDLTVFTEKSFTEFLEDYQEHWRTISVSAETQNVMKSNLNSTTGGVSRNSTKGPSSEKSKRKTNDEAPLLKVVKNKKKGITNYAALKSAGFIKDPNEYLRFL